MDETELLSADGRAIEKLREYSSKRRDSQRDFDHDFAGKESTVNGMIDNIIEFYADPAEYIASHIDKSSNDPRITGKQRAEYRFVCEILASEAGILKEVLEILSRQHRNNSI
jgi:hypothetical protein